MFAEDMRNALATSKTVAFSKPIWVDRRSATAMILRRKSTASETEVLGTLRQPLMKKAQARVSPSPYFCLFFK
jgi:hypothetical protein